MNASQTRRRTLASACLLIAFAGPAGAAAAPQITTPVNVTKPDVDPQRTYAAPFLLANPRNAQQVVGSFLEFRTKRCGLVRSLDAGQTWKLLDASPTLKSYPFCEANNSNIFQAPMAWGRNNTLYMAMVGWDTPDSRQKVSVQLARSTDLGDSWTTTMVHDARPTQDPKQETDRPVTVIVVDSKSAKEDIVYVTYRRSIVNQTPGNSVVSQPMVAVSTDGGKTFAEPVSAVGDFFAADGPRGQAISSATTVLTASPTTTTTAPAGSLAEKPNQVINFGGSNAGLTVDGKGTVYAAWKSTTANVVPSPPSGIFLSKSVDTGKTWSVTQVQPFRYENGSTFLEPFVVWSPGGGSAGTLHLVTEGSTRPDVSGYSTILYLRSTDGGKTWTEPKVLPDDDPKALKGKYIPNISLAPNGRVDIAWWDTRDDPGIRSNDVYYTYSTDNGASWAKNTRITDQTVDRRFGVWANNFDQSSPPSLASTDAYALVGWDDTRFSLNDKGTVQLVDPSTGATGIGGGVQDMFVSAVQFRALGGGSSKTARLILGGAVGLLVVGIVLAVAALGSRRRMGGAEATATPGARSPADVR